MASPRVETKYHPMTPTVSRSECPSGFPEDGEVKMLDLDWFWKDLGNDLCNS